MYTSEGNVIHFMFLTNLIFETRRLQMLFFSLKENLIFFGSESL